MIDSLTSKELLFVQEYVVNGFNGKRAYMKAYKTDNENLASTEACKLLKKAKIQNALEIEEGGFRQIARQHGLDRQAIVKKLKDLIDSKEGKTVNAAIVILARLTGDFSPEKKVLEVESTLGNIDISKLDKEQLEKLKASLLLEL